MILSKSKNFIYCWYFSTNHKEISRFALSVGLVGLMLSVLKRIELATPLNDKFERFVRFDILTILFFVQFFFEKIGFLILNKLE